MKFGVSGWESLYEEKLYGGTSYSEKWFPFAGYIQAETIIVILFDALTEISDWIGVGFDCLNCPF